MNRPLVIYHGEDCSDGFTSAWCFYHKDNKKYDFFKGSYQAPMPKVNDSDVYLTDFSYKRDQLIEMSKYANSITILDHHVSAFKDLENIESDEKIECEVKCIFDINRSGAGITWDYLFPNEQRPILLSYVEDRDLWRFNLPHCHEIMASIYSYDFDFRQWDTLMNITKDSSEFMQLLTEGTAIQRNIDKEAYSIIKSSLSETELCGFTVPLINCPRYLSSQIGHIICTNRSFGVTYFNTDNHQVFNLRSDNRGIDVSIIAEYFNGGGHKHAAGFKLKLDELNRFQSSNTDFNVKLIKERLENG